MEVILNDTLNKLILHDFHDSHELPDELEKILLEERLDKARLGY